MKNRTFGVEIECGHIGGPLEVRKVLRGIGLPVGTRNTGWHVGTDGSGVEARSPILRGPNGYAELRAAMTAIRKSGGIVTDYDGLHVHHGVPELLGNKDEIVKLVRSWMDNIRLIHQFIAPRRRNGGPCPDWNEVEFSRLVTEGTTDSRSHQTYNASLGRYVGPIQASQCGPRGSLNLWSLEEHDTVEFRSHEGTLDSRTAEAWVRFGQRFINAIIARKTPMPRCNNAEELLRRVRLGKGVSKRLIEKPMDETYLNISEWRVQRALAGLDSYRY